ncbi:MAG TPA: hypothetical protein VNJ52_01850 [Patescibacteria group bacterium]|nr:hypothetical protein [Patescibacteria group bacterium]
MTGKSIRRHFDRQIFGDLIVFWFGVWIVWWFRRWLGHGPIDTPVPTGAAGLAYYSLAMRTLLRSLMQSFLIACIGLAAWRIFRRRAPKGSQHSS